MKKWRSIAAGAGCFSLLFTAGTVPVSASDEITEIPEQSIVYWSMWDRTRGMLIPKNVCKGNAKSRHYKIYHLFF